MTHNVLVLLSVRGPAGAVERRDLGLPRGPGRGARGAPEGYACCRVEGLSVREAAALSAAMRRAGGAGAPAPSRPRTPHAPRPAAAGRMRATPPGPGRAVVLRGEDAAFRRLTRLAGPALAGPAREIGDALRHAAGPPPAWTLRDGRPAPTDRTLVMGILNVTPDSFSDGGRYAGRAAALARAVRMAEEGADIVDVGGESTRPGSRPVPLEEEMRRVLPVLEEMLPLLRRRPGGGPLVSIDTTKAEVARRAAALGIDLLNDISGLRFDPAMPAVAAETGLPLVLQHLRGRPRDMQRAPRYALLLPEVAAALRDAAERARRAGVPPDRLLIDPGFGFGKRRRHNLTLLRRLAALRSLGMPILIGASRKSFLGEGRDLPVGERLEASLAAEALALAGGAAIIRAHDVRQAVRVARLCDAVLRGPSGHR